MDHGVNVWYMLTPTRYVKTIYKEEDFKKNGGDSQTFSLYSLRYGTLKILPLVPHNRSTTNHLISLFRLYLACNSMLITVLLNVYATLGILIPKYIINASSISMILTFYFNNILKKINIVIDFDMVSIPS